jgi:molecular chaperone DnaJ
MGGFNNPFKKQNKHHHKPDITLKETIFFKETVLGCSREIAFKRDEKCSHCDGEGGKQIDNGCKRCNGKGMTMTQQGNTIYQSVCTECRGRINQQSCDKCNGRGYNSNDTRFTVNIPAGITPEKNVVNIGNQGHFIGRSMVGDQHSRVLIACNITPQDDLRLVDDDVVSNVSISLLEALEGTTKMIPTIDGKRSTIVIAGIKNKDEIVIPNLGMKRRGNQRVIVSVQYPDNVSKLIEAMKDKVGE